MTKREEFYQVALQLIYQKGFKATTMREIAEAIGIEAASIYNYIDSKQTLLVDLLFEMSHAFHQNINHINTSTYAPIDKIKAIVALHIRLTVENPYKAALLTNEWRHLKEPNLEKFIAEREYYEQQVKSILIQGIEDHTLKPMSADIISQTFLGSLRWLFYWYIEHKEEANPIELEKQMTDFIINGLIKR